MAICIILLLQGAGGCGLPSSHPDIPRAQKGVLNLAGWDFRTNGPVALNGEWEFYWSQQLDAAAPSSSRKEAPPSSGLITVPGVWNGFLADGRPIPGLGFATYRLKVLLDRPYSHLALKCLDAATSFRLFVNGQRLASSGLPGKTPADTRPGYEPGVFVFSTPYDQLDILIHVSNFDHWQGGLWEAIELGLPDQLARKRQGHLYFQFFLFGSLLIMGLYHLGLFLLRPAERSPLYFGLLCLLISIRTMATGETYIVEYLPGLDWNLLNQSIYIGLYLVVPCFGLFLRSLIPGEISKTVVSLALLLGVLLSLLVLTTPA
ncbi:MAG: 7TM-DISM domain-containing protein, partial [Proteobacteria bacterium]|nr:7TM-DISM domain-containing protein [Pseudomonadota bacterium]